MSDAIIAMSVPVKPVTQPVAVPAPPAGTPLKTSAFKVPGP